MKQYLVTAAAATLVALAGGAVEGAFTIEGITTPETIACANKGASANWTLPTTSSRAPG